LGFRGRGVFSTIVDLASKNSLWVQTIHRHLEEVGRNNILQAKSGSHTGAAQDASAAAPDAAVEVCMELGQHAGSAQNSDVERHFVMRIWGKAWTLSRGAFEALHYYLYAVTWSDFVAREARAEVCIDTDALLNDENRVAILKASGLCVVGARIWEGLEDVFTITWSGRQGQRLAVGNAVWLSKTDPEVDALSYLFPIMSRTASSLTVKKVVALPDDSWNCDCRVDLCSMPNVEEARLNALYLFCTHRKSIMRDLVIDDGMRSAGGTRTLNQRAVKLDEDAQFNILRVGRKHGLNNAQMHALTLSCLHAKVLVQGPPGTGKTRTAAGLADLQQALSQRVMICAPSNQATHVVAEKCIEAGLVVWKWFSKDAERDLSEELRRKFAPVSLPQIAREELLAAGYDEASNQFQRHVTNKCRELVCKDRDRIIICTTNASCTAAVLRELKFDYVIIDESAQASEVDVVQPLSLLHRDGCGVQIGDHKQLPATVKSVRNKAFELQRSMFERLFSSPGIVTCQLVEQRRMHPSIASYPNEEYYGGTLVSCTAWTLPPQGFDWPSDHPVAFVQCAGAETVAVDSSRQNDAEASKVVNIISDIVKGGDVVAEAIYALAPYRAQVELIAAKLRRLGLHAVDVQTVNKSQGGEKDLVVLSTVRCNKNGRQGFVGDHQRLNVAMTRAKHGLIIVGDECTLGAVDSSTVWTPFFQKFSREGWIVGRASPRDRIPNIFARKESVEPDEDTKAEEAVQENGGSRVVLSGTDLEKLLGNAQRLGRMLMNLPYFRFLVDYSLALPPHQYAVEDYPSDFRLYDRKMWSHKASFCRSGIPSDATNLVYWKCVVLLMVTEETMPESWGELLRYVAMLPLAVGVDLHTMWSAKKADAFLSDVGDIYESIAGLCMSEVPESLAFRARVESLGWHDDTKMHAHTIWYEMGRLAECMYLLSRNSSWTERELFQVLLQGKTFDVEQSMAGVPRKNWLTRFWPELVEDVECNARGEKRARDSVESEDVWMGSTQHARGSYQHNASSGSAQWDRAAWSGEDFVWSNTSGSAQWDRAVWSRQNFVWSNTSGSAQWDRTTRSGWDSEWSNTRANAEHAEQASTYEGDARSSATLNEQEHWSAGFLGNQWRREDWMVGPDKCTRSNKDQWNNLVWTSGDRTEGPRQHFRDGVGAGSPGKEEQDHRPARFETRRPEERAPGDSRFAARRADRVYVCDNASCRSRNAYGEIKKALPFDGQYVLLLETRGYSAAELKQLYEAKNVDATWWCSACHRRPSELDLDETRRRIEAFDIGRCERTCLLGASVFFCWAPRQVLVSKDQCVF